MTSPTDGFDAFGAALAELVVLMRRRAGLPQAAAVETFAAPGACLNCSGTVWYPFDGQLWSTAHCKHCGPVTLLPVRPGFAYRWQ